MRVPRLGVEDRIVEALANRYAVPIEGSTAQSMINARLRDSGWIAHLLKRLVDESDRWPFFGDSGCMVHSGAVKAEEPSSVQLPPGRRATERQPRQ
jgi:hypothetical protein